MVEDDKAFAKAMQYHLSLNPENEVEVFTKGKDCIANLHKKPDLITLDYFMPGENGSDVLEKIKKFNKDLPVIIVSGQTEINVALELLKQGAYDYVVKDHDTKERLWNSVNHLRNHNQLIKRVDSLQQEVEEKYDFGNLIIGNSSKLKPIFNLIDKAAKSNIVVSITGETGSGKEVVAKTIHYNSPRKDKPFIAVNVAAIPHELIEAELFGHEKGAFTGALNRRIGKFEEAQNGTVFLDEIGEMDPMMQTKLLRVLQEQEVTRVGSNEPLKLNVRVITATHKNLMDEVKKGNFREDLFYRLMGITISMPPLRERENDLMLLTQHFVKEFCSKNKMKTKKLTPEAYSKLASYNFPGNIRELKAIIELAVVLSDDDVIEPDHLQIQFSSLESEMLSKEMTLAEYEKLIIGHFLKKYNNKVRLVASKLDIGKSTIYRLFKDENLNNSES
jgi:DNA-binding NtrC family response regulator